MSRSHAHSPRPERRFRFITHPKAATDELKAAVEQLRRAGHAVDVTIPDAPGDAVAIAEESARQGATTVVAVGGDGTINEVVNGLGRIAHGERPTLGIVATGSANDLATAAALPIRDPLAATRIILESAAVPVDLGRLDESLFVNAASGGFGAELTVRTSEQLKQWFGGGAYLMTGLTSPDAIKPTLIHVRSDDLEWSGEIYVLAVGNGQQMGGGFRLCQDALLNDGLLDVTIIPAGDESGMLGLLHDLLVAASPREYASIVYKKVTWLEVKAPDGLQINLDGEPRRGTSFRFDAIPHGVKLHLPPSSPLLQRP